MEDNRDLIQYVKRLGAELNKTYVGRTQQDIATLLGFGPTTYHKIFSKYKVSVATLDEIAKKIDFISLEKFVERLPIFFALENLFTGEGSHWISYCFNKRRRMYESNWTFRKKKRYCDEKSENCEEYIEVIRETVNYRYAGELTINPDLTISISLKAHPDYSITYNTKLFGNEPFSFYDSIGFLCLEALVIRKKEAFTSLEVLVKSDKPVTPRTIQYENIHALNNEKNIPQNPAYLAFNYLTRIGSKSRRLIDNYSINTENENGGFLDYKHDILISCPIGFISGPQEFTELKRIVDKIISTLETVYGFDRINIHCEIAKYESYNDIRRDDRYVFFETRKFIKSTHFISILPAALSQNNSAVYMEIYFRIQRKLPAIVFVEDKTILPSLLQGLLDNPDRPINFAVKDIKLKQIPAYLNSAKEYLFSLSV